MCACADGRGLVHHGLVHPPSADLAAVFAPLIAERLARQEPVLAVLPPATAARLRDRLPTLPGLHTIDSGSFYRHPGRVLGHYLSWTTDTSRGQPATIVAAPDPGGDNAHRAALWMHIEALTNQALAACDLTLVCAYSENSATATAVRQAHPSLLNGDVIPNPDHLSIDDFLARYPLPRPADLGPPEITRIFDHPRQLAELRRIVDARAVHAQLPTTRRQDLVLAVTEVATNALQYGIPPAAVCLWTTSTSVITQITDNGRFSQPLAGLLPPPGNQRRASGLWMARQLCDELYLWPDPTTLRLHMNRLPAP